MNIRLRREGVKSQDALGILTSESYKYLGIIIDQPTGMTPQINKLKDMERGMVNVIRLLRSTMLNVGSGFTILRTIFEAKLGY